MRSGRDLRAATLLVTLGLVVVLTAVAAPALASPPFLPRAVSDHSPPLLEARPWPLVPARAPARPVLDEVATSLSWRGPSA